VKAGLGVLNGGDTALGDAHPGGDAFLSDAEAAAPVGALLDAQLVHTGGDRRLASGVGVELVDELPTGVMVELAAAHPVPPHFR
jgi:hypothetical protein